MTVVPSATARYRDAANFGKRFKPRPASGRSTLETKPPSALRGGWPSFAAARRADAGTVLFQEETPRTMHTPIPVRRSWLIPLAALGLGCSSTGTGGLSWHGNDPKIQTIASVGDRPVATKTGGATSSAVADLDAPASPRGPRRPRLGPRGR